MRTVKGLLLVLVSCGVASGQAQFTWCGGIPNGQWIGVQRVSPGGAAVVGTANFPTPGGGTIGRAFRWTAATGIVNLGTLLPSTLQYPYSDAYDVSGDGSIVVGGSFTSSIRAFRWTAAGMAELPLPAGATSAIAIAISPDGSSIVGGCGLPGAAHIARWAGGIAEDLGGPPFRIAAVPKGASADLATVVGYADTNFGTDDRGFLFDAQGWADIGVLPGDLQSRLYAVSADGLVGVGESHGTISISTHPLRWTRSQGLEPIPLPPGILGATALGVSGHGDVIIEVPRDGSPYPDGLVWTRWGGVQSVRAVLQSYGVNLSGVVDVQVTAITPDGRTLAGTAGATNQLQAWVATLPAGFGCYGNCDGSTTPPVLNVEDFICFLNKFTAGDPGANCDGSSVPPVLNVGDFVCFLNKFEQGCP